MARKRKHRYTQSEKLLIRGYLDYMRHSVNAALSRLTEQPDFPANQADLGQKAYWVNVAAFLTGCIGRIDYGMGVRNATDSAVGKDRPAGD